jgi:catechol 2,3-dioxygenase-like lactoylglutathione lyase family enzyme
MNPAKSVSTSAANYSWNWFRVQEQKAVLGRQGRRLRPAWCKAGQGLSHQTGQESRSTGHRALRSVTVMCIAFKHERRQGMKAHVSAILLGVEDMDRSKRFYTDGLGWEVEQDYGVSVFFEPDGGSLVGFYGRDGLAAQVGTSPEGSGFSGMVFNYVVRSEARVEEIVADAQKAGATILKPAATLPWGGHGGSFADPDGYIWSIAYSAQGEDQPYAE